MPKKLKYRHPAVYTHRKYDNVNKLLIMETPYKKVKLNNDYSVYLWKTSGGSVRIGAVSWLVDLLRKYPQPSIDFLNEFLPAFRGWQKDCKLLLEQNLPMANDGMVIFPETEAFNKILIDKKFERFIARKKHQHALEAFTNDCLEAYKTKAKMPYHKDYGISYTEAQKIKEKLKG